MLTFKKFIVESQILAEENKNASDALGKSHEIRTAAALNHVVEHPHILNLNDDELKQHWEKHKNDFHEKHLPTHYRDENQKTPSEVYKETSASHSDDDHFQNFKNTVSHVKELHKHLKSQGFDPSSIHNVVWTSQSGDIGNHLGRTPNSETDDSDIMFHAKHQDGTIKPVGLSLKVGKAKNPNLKNKTVHTLLSGFKGIDDHINSAKEKIKSSVDSHLNTLHGIGLADKNKKGEIVLGRSNQLKYKDAIGQGQFGAGGKLVKTKQAYSQENVDKIGKPAFESSQRDLKAHASTMADIYNKVLSLDDGHNQMTNHVRSIIGQKPEDFHPVRAFMNLNSSNQVAGHHIENHIENNDKLLSKTHRYQVEHGGGQIVKIHGYDHEGNKLFTIDQTHKKSNSPVSSNVVVHTMKLHKHGKDALNS